MQENQGTGIDKNAKKNIELSKVKSTFSSEEVLLCLEIQRKDSRAGSAIIVGFTMVHQIRAVPKTQLLSRSETNGT